MQGQFDLETYCVKKNTLFYVYLPDESIWIQDSFKQVDLSSDVIQQILSYDPHLVNKLKIETYLVKKWFTSKELEHGSRSHFLLGVWTKILIIWLNGGKQWSPRVFIFLSWTPGALQVLTQNLICNPGALKSFGSLRQILKSSNQDKQTFNVAYWQNLPTDF